MKRWSEARVRRAIARAKRSALGRTFCRLFGDRTGGVMMEYVILGVLIAAAAIAAVTLFGQQISDSFMALTKAIAQPGQSAEQSQPIQDNKVKIQIIRD